MTDSFGFVLNKLEIKILILFILRRLPEPIVFGDLAELSLCDDGISYFDVADCLAELEKNGHIDKINDMFFITKKGERNGETTEVNLPYTVRMKVEKMVSVYRVAQDRDALIKASHSYEDDLGCKVRLSLSDGLGEIISMELFAPNEVQAVAIEKGFRKNAESFYNRLIEMLVE